MTLGWKLFILFCAFLAVLAVVIVTAFRERSLGKALKADDFAAQQASDARVLAIVFGAIFGGMLFTLVAAWLVFF